MKKKLLVLLISVIPALMPNLASAMAIEIDEGELQRSLEINEIPIYGTWL
jgi:hypothetical protein